MKCFGRAISVFTLVISHGLWFRVTSCGRSNGGGLRDIRLPSAIVSFIKLTRGKCLCLEVLQETLIIILSSKNLQKAQLFSVNIFCFFLDFVSFYSSCKLVVSFIGAGCLRKWVKHLKKGNPSSSKMRKNHLSPVSLQWCHHFLLGQGELSSCRSRCICYIGKDVFGTVTLFSTPEDLIGRKKVKGDIVNFNNTLSRT